MCAKKCSIHVEKVKVITGLDNHNNRKKIKDDAKPYIDKSRSHLNYDLVSCRDYSASCKEKVENAGLVRKIRKDAVLAGSFVVNAPTTDNHDLNKQFFKDTFDFLENLVGRENVISAQIHNDEKTPHLHFVFVPLIKKPNKKGFVENCLSFKDLIGTKPLLKKLQTDFYLNVGKKYGLERGEPSDKKHITTREYRANKARVDAINKAESQAKENEKVLKEMQAWAENYTNELGQALENNEFQAKTLFGKLTRAADVLFAGDAVGDNLSKLQMANKSLLVENKNVKEKAVQAIATAESKASSAIADANKKLAAAEKIQNNFHAAVEKEVAEKLVVEVEKLESKAKDDLAWARRSDSYKIQTLEKENGELKSELRELKDAFNSTKSDLEWALGALENWRTADDATLLEWGAEFRAERERQQQQQQQKRSGGRRG